LVDLVEHSLRKELGFVPKLVAVSKDQNLYVDFSTFLLYHWYMLDEDRITENLYAVLKQSMQPVY
jgi:hypothetical protein